MKGTIKFSLKLFVLMIAASVISIISMTLVLSASIQFVYKVIMGLLFIAFTEILVWNNASQRGEEDTKSGIFSPGKGFVSASIALLPAIILAVYYIILSYHGWEGNISSLHQAYTSFCI